MKAEFYIKVTSDTDEAFQEVKERMDGILTELRESGEANITTASVSFDEETLAKELEDL